MEPLMQSQVFFFISSVGFVFLWVLVAVFLFYLIRGMRTLSRIMDKAERDINAISESTKEIFEDVRDNSILSFLFRRKKKKSKV